MFQINAVLLNFLILKKHSFHKNMKHTTVFNIDNKKCFWAANQHIRMISEESCDTEDWSNMKIQLYITWINYNLQYIHIENSYVKL